MLKEGKIISSFPASGKTYCGENYSNIVDLGRTSYKHGENEGNNETIKGIERPVHPDRPMNYYNAILEFRKKFDIVLINESILKVLQENNVPYSVVVPTINCKEEYKQRMIDRGNNTKLISKITDNFEQYIEENLNDNYAEEIYRLFSGMYLSDLFEELGFVSKIPNY